MVFRDKAKRRRILVVEDDWAVLEVLKLMLEEEGYVVVTAKNGREAIKLAASKPFDLVLTDISMPETSGIDVARTLREESKTADVRIAIHTGLDEHWVRERFDDYDLFLTKAADTEVLVERIHRLLDSDVPPRARREAGAVEAARFTATDAALAQQALRDAMGLDAELFSTKALVGMLGEEVDQLRRLGRSDAEIARIVSDAIGKDFGGEALAR